MMGITSTIGASMNTNNWQGLVDAADEFIRIAQESGNLTAYEHAALMATYVVPFARVPDMQNSVADIHLPGFGMFQVREVYNPDDVGSPGVTPGRVGVLTPCDFYPAMSYTAQRAMAMRYLALSAKATAEDAARHEAEMMANAAAREHLFADTRKELMKQQVEWLGRQNKQVEQEFMRQSLHSAQAAPMPPVARPDPGKITSVLGGIRTAMGNIMGVKITP